jgi:hypothetical protein
MCRLEKSYVQGSVAEFDQNHTVLDGVLKKYVANARVDYRGLKFDSKGLVAYLSDASAVRKATFESWSPQEQLALLINVYNAAIH